MRQIKGSWTADDDSGLAAAVQAGVSTLRLCARYRRPGKSVVRRIRELGLEPTAVKRLPKADRQPAGTPVK